MNQYPPEPSSTYSYATAGDDYDDWWSNGAASDSPAAYHKPSPIPTPTDFPLLEEDQPSFNFPKWLYLAISSMILYWVYLFCKSYYDSYILKRDALEKRRRLGIPDDDDRPTHIAYAAAAQRQLEKTAAQREQEEREAQAKEQQNTPWAQLGREFKEPLATGNAFRAPLRDGLSFRPNAHRPVQSGFDSRANTLSSVTSFSLHNPVPPQQYGFNTGAPLQSYPTSTTAWQDRYAPDTASQSQYTANRVTRAKPRAVRPDTTLGRRSRKNLNLDFGPEAESDIRQSSKRRLNDWGRDYEIDGDEEARWAYEGEFFPTAPLRDSNRIRKRDDEDDGLDDAMPPVRSRRKLGGSDGPNASSQSKTGRSQKRKARDDDTEQNEIEDVQRPISKTKKRVRVVSYHDSQSAHSRDADMEDVDHDDDVSSDPLCGGRKVGEKWSEAGVNYMVGQDGRRLREVLIKEKEQKYKMPADSKHRDRKAFIYSIIKQWLDEEQFAKAKADRIVYDEKRDGKLSPSKGNKLIVAEPSLTEESTPKSEPGSEWGSVKGQTPLKSGFLRTTSGHDRPPIPALFRNFGQHVDQARLAHIGSPGKKALALGAAMPKALKGASKWERQNREAQALAALKSSRSTSKPDAIAKESESTANKAVAAAVSAPSVTAPKPSPFALIQAPSEPKPTSSFTLPTAIPPKAASASVPTAPPVITITPASHPVTGPTNPPANPFVVAPTKPASVPSNIGPAPSTGPASNAFTAPSLAKPLFSITPSTETPKESQLATNRDKPVIAFPAIAPPTATSNAQSQSSTKPEGTPAQPFAFGQPPSALPTTLSGTSQQSAALVPTFGKPGSAFSFGDSSKPSGSGPTTSTLLFSTTTAAKPPISFGSGSNIFAANAKPAETKIEAQPNVFGVKKPEPTTTAPITFGGTNVFSMPKENRAPTSAPTSIIPPATANTLPTPTSLFSAPASKPLNIFGAAASASTIATPNEPKQDVRQVATSEGAPKPFSFGAATTFGNKPGFGNTSSPFAAISSSTTADKDVKPSFSFGATSVAPSGPRPATTPAPTSAFGGFGGDNTKPPSAFGASGFSGFGGSFGKPAEAQKAEDKPSTSTFKFSSTTSSSAAPEAVHNTSATTPSTFSFGAGTTGGFQFGATSGLGNASNQTNGNSSTSAFGNPSSTGSFMFGAAVNNDVSRAQTPGDGTPSPAEAVFKLGRANAGSPGPSSRPRKPLPRKQH